MKDAAFPASQGTSRIVAGKGHCPGTFYPQSAQGHIPGWSYLAYDEKCGSVCNTILKTSRECTHSHTSLPTGPPNLSP